MSSISGTSRRRYRPYAIFAERRKPLLIWFAPVVIGLAALEELAFLGLVTMDGGSGLVYGGVRLSAVQYLTRALPVSIVLDGALLALAYGLFVERHWARPLAVWIWLGGAALDVLVLPSVATVEAFLPQLARSALYTLFAAWYFYRKPAVVRYYDELGRQRVTA